MAENQVSFSDLTERLERIEKGLLSQKTVLNFTDFCIYVGISKSHGYKLTSTREVPHFCPNGKTLFFSKEEIDQWLLRNPIKTIATLKREVKGGAKSC
jgi:predicted DNA-binding transcriptional regulator AlpA